MSELDLDAIEARAKAATPGPWEFHDEDSPRNPWVTRKIVRDNEPYHELNILKVRMARHARNECCWPPTSTDAEFIAHARTDVPALVSRVRELEDAIEQAMEECRKTGDYNAAAKHLNIRSARLLAVEMLHILGSAS
ncbi:hypothetical protein BH769_gp92 [Gordonia phage BritBrat]|uniref:Uncharacterized protein n=1 Tax=Gordonia phage BritBrat TaxID=1838064 RepID=A0A166Y107_9CAUD|nr:hypothetical protein BH769_gp92 [Gordonia phage BritBrat]ANA85295.1 hypothetical protein PBI_BRITBRAT_92 [Gordonia phage BritBrat]